MSVKSLKELVHCSLDKRWILSPRLPANMCRHEEADSATERRCKIKTNGDWKLSVPEASAEHVQRQSGFALEVSLLIGYRGSMEFDFDSRLVPLVR